MGMYSLVKHDYEPAQFLGVGVRGLAAPGQRTPGAGSYHTEIREGATAEIREGATDSCVEICDLFVNSTFSIFSGAPAEVFLGFAGWFAVVGGLVPFFVWLGLDLWGRLGSAVGKVEDLGV